MYYYIYDSFLYNKKYQKTLEQIETRICDLGIKGNIEKLNPVRDVSVVVNTGLENGCQNFIIVGNDHSLTSALNSLVGRDVTVGIIPIGEPSHIASILGIPKGSEACLAISQRVTAEIDVGQINDKYFLTSVEVGFESDEKEKRKAESHGRRFAPNYFSVARTYKPKEVMIEIDRAMEVQAEIFNLSIINIKDTGYAKRRVNPTDGLLNISLVPKITKMDIWKNMRHIRAEEYEQLPDASLFKGQSITIKSQKEVLVNADGKPFGKAPIYVGLAKEKLKIIVGKKRQF